MTTPVPPPSPTIATRGPAGRWGARHASTQSISCFGVVTRRIPAARQAASTAAESLASAPVCEAAARAPASLPPAASRTTCLPARERRLPGPRERPAVAEVLAVDADHAGVLVGRERLDELRGLDVGLVPERGEARDADAVLRAEQAQLEGEVAALGDDPERAGRELVHAEVERRRCVVDAEAVRPEHHRSGAAHLLDDAALELLAAVVDLAEAGRDRDDPARAGSECVVDAGLERRGRHRDHDELGRAG